VRNSNNGRLVGGQATILKWPDVPRYIEITEALKLLIADISDAEVSSTTATDPDPTSPWSKREFGFTLLVVFSWRQAQAITLLYLALCDGTLASVVRQRSGGLMHLIGKDWKAAKLWRHIITNGVVLALPGDELTQHDGEAVLLETSVFKAWLDQRPRPKPAEPRNDACQKWLENEMRTSPDRRPRTRQRFCADAVARFGVTRRHFNNVIWPTAIRNTGAMRWSDPGPQ
jgi:hypothetical protein